MSMPMSLFLDAAFRLARLALLIYLSIDRPIAGLPTQAALPAAGHILIIGTHSDLGCDVHFAPFYEEKRWAWLRKRESRPVRTLNFSFQNFTAQYNLLNDLAEQNETTLEDGSDFWPFPNYVERDAEGEMVPFAMDEEFLDEHFEWKPIFFLKIAADLVKPRTVRYTPPWLLPKVKKPYDSFKVIPYAADAFYYSCRDTRLGRWPADEIYSRGYWAMKCPPNTVLEIYKDYAGFDNWYHEPSEQTLRRYVNKAVCKYPDQRTKRSIQAFLNNCVNVEIPEKWRRWTTEHISFTATAVEPVKQSHPLSDSRSPKYQSQPLVPLDWISITNKGSGHQTISYDHATLSIEVDASERHYAFQACGRSSFQNFVLLFYSFSSGFTENDSGVDY